MKTNKQKRDAYYEKKYAILSQVFPSFKMFVDKIAKKYAAEYKTEATLGNYPPRIILSFMAKPAQEVDFDTGVKYFARALREVDLNIFADETGFLLNKFPEIECRRVDKDDPQIVIYTFYVKEQR